MSLNSLIRRLMLRPLTDRKTAPLRKKPRRANLRVEGLEDRTVPALQLIYGGTGTALTLTEVAAATDNVTITEPVAGTLRIDLRDGTSLLAYPTDRVAYGRLSRLLTLGKRRAPKGQCHLDFLLLAHGNSRQIENHRKQCSNGQCTHPILHSRWRFNKIRSAEGTGVEPATGYPASHFQCDR